MLSVTLQAGPDLPVAFRFIFLLVPLLVAALGFAIAAFPRRMTQWQIRGSDGTTRVEPGETLLLVIRLGGVAVAVLALLMAFGASAMFP